MPEPIPVTVPDKIAQEWHPYLPPFPPASALASAKIRGEVPLGVMSPFATALNDTKQPLLEAEKWVLPNNL